MYIQIRRDSSNLDGCSPLKNRNSLIILKPKSPTLNILPVMSH